MPIGIIASRLLVVRLEFELLVRLTKTGRVEVVLALRQRRRLGPIGIILAGVSGHPADVLRLRFFFTNSSLLPGSRITRNVDTSIRRERQQRLGYVTYHEVTARCFSNIR